MGEAFPGIEVERIFVRGREVACDVRVMVLTAARLL
jgi:hypothetical protein